MAGAASSECPRTPACSHPPKFMFDPWFWSIALVTIIVVALSKSGFLGSLGMVGVPLLSLVMPAREAAGVTRTEVYQPADDPNYVVIDLRFENVAAATNFREFLIHGPGGSA